MKKLSVIFLLFVVISASAQESVRFVVETNSTLLKGGKLDSKVNIFYLVPISKVKNFLSVCGDRSVMVKLPLSTDEKIVRDILPSFSKRVDGLVLVNDLSDKKEAIYRGMLYSTIYRALAAKDSLVLFDESVEHFRNLRKELEFYTDGMIQQPENLLRPYGYIRIGEAGRLCDIIRDVHKYSPRMLVMSGDTWLALKGHLEELNNAYDFTGVSMDGNLIPMKVEGVTTKYCFYNPNSGQVHILCCIDSAKMGKEIRVDPIGVQSLLSFDFKRGYFKPIGANNNVNTNGRNVAVFRYSIESGETGSVEVTEEEKLNVNEIIARYQANCEHQKYLLRNYQSEMVLFMNFRVLEDMSATIQIDYSYYWQRQSNPLLERRSVSLNGSKWDGLNTVELPVIEPEKVATPPFELKRGVSYNYQLSGVTNKYYVVSFKPILKDGSYTMGKIWIRRDNFQPYKIESSQTGLTAPVTLNHQTDYYGQVNDENGNTYYIVKETKGQQLFEIASRKVRVDRTIVYNKYRINQSGFRKKVQDVEKSDSILLVDGPKGKQYYVKENGHRVLLGKSAVENRFVIYGGLYNSAYDYPVPLAGYSYYSSNFRGSGWEFNVMAAIALNYVNASKTNFWGDWDLGIRGKFVFYNAVNALYPNGVECDETKVNVMKEDLYVDFSRSIGQYQVIRFGTEGHYLKFSDNDDTAVDFTVPEDVVETGIFLQHTTMIKGLSLDLEGHWLKRSDWVPYGFDGNSAWSDNAKTYNLYSVKLSKDVVLPNFSTIGLSTEYQTGERTDRFSNPKVMSFSQLRLERFWKTRVGWSFQLSQMQRCGISLSWVKGWDKIISPEKATGTLVFDADSNFRLGKKNFVRASFRYIPYSGIQDVESDWMIQIMVLRIF